MSAAGGRHAPADRLPLRQVIAAWQDVLGVDEILAEDNFFDLGGASFQVLLVKRHLDAALGRDIPVIDFFRFPTVAQLATHLHHTAAVTSGDTSEEP